MNEPDLAIDHPRFRTVASGIFTRTFVDSCMNHQCVNLEPRFERVDVCCQYGCDVDIAERAAIEARGDEIRALLRDDAKHVPWFEDEELADPEYPSGKVVRSTVHNGACIFISHDQRGCGIHRAALEGGWPMQGVKPAICRLFPVSYEGDSIIIAEEYLEYSCAYADGPTLYRLAREQLAEMFGAELVSALDAVEARVLSTAQPRRLPLAR